MRSQEMVAGYTRLGTGDHATDRNYTEPTFIREETIVNSFAIAKPFAEIPYDAFLGF